MVMRYNKDGLEYIPTDKTIEKVLDKENSDEFDIIDYLVELSDSLDKNGNHFFSNFTDFIIKKASEAYPADYSSLFSDLILRINSSDLDMRIEKIKMLAKNFTDSVNEGVKNDVDIDLAKKSAYFDAVSMFNNIMRDSDA